MFYARMDVRPIALVLLTQICITSIKYCSSVYNRSGLIFFIFLLYQDYPKLSQSYYALLECLAQDHMTFISNLEPQVFLYIMSTISEGLTALGKSTWYNDWTYLCLSVQ